VHVSPKFSGKQRAAFDSFAESVDASLIHDLAWLRPKMPIVPVDLRTLKSVVSYNPLRERDGAGSVLVAGLVDAISFVWGETGTNKTPRFERKGTDLLTALYEMKLTLVESEYLLVCAATEGNVVSKRDARLFSTLLITGLWHAASARGKKTRGRPLKPFRVWLDEFQTMLCPTIAENLDQASGA
jgi:hypothetical protein